MTTAPRRSVANRACVRASTGNRRVADNRELARTQAAQEAFEHESLAPFALHAFPLNPPLRITAGQKLAVAVLATGSCTTTIQATENRYSGGTLSLSWDPSRSIFDAMTGTLSFMVVMR